MATKGVYHVLLLALLMWGTVHSGDKDKKDIKYKTASGRLIVNHGKEKWCVPAAWYSDADAKIIKVEKGGKQTRINEDGTWLAHSNETLKKIICTKDSDVTYDQFYATKHQHYMVGTLDFKKPMTGVHNMSTTKFPLVSYLKKSVSVIYTTMEGEDKKWAGLDWIREAAGYARMWWTKTDMTNRPAPSKLQLNNCNGQLPSDYKMPSADCADYFEPSAGEQRYKMDMPLEGSGAIHKSATKEHKDWFSIPTKFYHDPARKLLAVVSGDASKQMDKKAFSIGYWVNGTGTFLMMPGQSGCDWIGTWKYEDAVAGYGTPQLAWIGKAKVKHWWPKSAEGLEVNLYQGNYPMGPGFPMTSMVDKDGLYRGEIIYDWEMKHPPSRVFMDKMERKVPNIVNFKPDEKCKGFNFFAGGDDFGFETDGGQKATLVNWYCFLLLISVSLFSKFV